MADPQQTQSIYDAVGWRGNVTDTRDAAYNRRSQIHRDWLNRSPEEYGASKEIKDAWAAIPKFSYPQLEKQSQDHFKILEKDYPDINTFIAYPKEYKKVEYQTGKPRLEWNPEKGRRELTSKRSKVEVIPEGVSFLRSKVMEKVYDNVNKKLFNINAPEGASRHLNDELFIQYANMARERTKDFSKHPLYGAIKKRAQKILVQRGEGVQWEKAKAFGKGLSPVKLSLIHI